MPRAFSVLSSLKSCVIVIKGHFSWCCGKSFVYSFWSTSTLILLILPVVCLFWKAFGLHRKVGCEANHCWRQEEVNPSLGRKSSEKKTDHCRDGAWHTSEGRRRLPGAPRVLVPTLPYFCTTFRQKEGRQHGKECGSETDLPVTE